MDVFDLAEFSDMIMCYEEARGNRREALRMYQQRFPRRQHPYHSMFARLFRRLREMRCLRPQHVGGGRRNVRTPRFEEVLDRIANESSTSTRTVAHAMDNKSVLSVESVVGTKSVRIPPPGGVGTAAG